jgi:hypothetical protein
VYFDVSANVTGSIEKTEAMVNAFVAGLDHQQLFEGAVQQTALTPDHLPSGG